MKYLKVFAIVMLLGVATPVSSESFGIINLEHGDTVNWKAFTVVAQGFNFAEGDQLTIQVVVSNTTTGVVSSDTIDVTVR